MTKKDVATIVAKNLGVSIREVETTLDSFYATVMQEVANGETITIRGFGNFQPKKRKARLGRDIIRGITIEIPERTEPIFKPSDEFVKLVKEGGANGY